MALKSLRRASARLPSRGPRTTRLFGTRALGRRGQATTEYVLLMAVVLSFYLLISKALGRFGVQQKLMSPITVQFASAYQYGKIPNRVDSTSGELLRPLSDSKFRVFLNPKSN